MKHTQHSYIVAVVTMIVALGILGIACGGKVAPTAGTSVPPKRTSPAAQATSAPAEPTTIVLAPIIKLTPNEISNLDKALAHYHLDVNYLNFFEYNNNNFNVNVNQYINKYNVNQYINNKYLYIENNDIYLYNDVNIKFNQYEYDGIKYGKSFWIRIIKYQKWN